MGTSEGAGVGANRRRAFHRARARDLGMKRCGPEASSSIYVQSVNGSIWGEDSRVESEDGPGMADVV